jgi:hypothetical protein
MVSESTTCLGRLLGSRLSCELSSFDWGGTRSLNCNVHSSCQVLPIWMWDSRTHQAKEADYSGYKIKADTICIFCRNGWMQTQQAAKSNIMATSWHGLDALQGGMLTSSMRELMRSRLFFSTVLWLVCCFEPARVQDTS